MERDFKHESCRNPVALEHMGKVFPGLPQEANLSCRTFQQYLSECPDLAFDLVFSHGATVELVHPSFPLIREIRRATRERVVRVFNENQQTYPRFWAYEFLRSGFLLTKLVRMPPREATHTLMVFRRLAL